MIANVLVMLLIETIHCTAYFVAAAAAAVALYFLTSLLTGISILNTYI